MAIYKQGILGPFSGKVGTVVGSSWRGTPYIRSLATKVANPRTADQVKVRSRLTAVTLGLKQFAYLISAGYVNSGSLSPWAAAVKDNFKHLKDGDTPQLDFTAVTLSNGSALFDVSVTKTASAVNFTWTAPADGDDFYGGSLYAGAYNVANGKAVSTSADLTNQTGGLDYQSILSGTDDDDVHVYFFVASATTSTATTHLGD